MRVVAGSHRHSRTKKVLADRRGIGTEVGSNTSQRLAVSVELSSLVDLRLAEGGIAALGDCPIDVLEHSCRVDSEASRQILNGVA